MTSEPADPVQRRRIHYVDEAIQKWMLAALVTIETTLSGAAVWLMHWRLSEVIEQNLYRVHVSVSVPLLSQLLQETYLLLAMFLMINLILLLAAQAIWARYVDCVLLDFSALIDRTRQLDFTSDPQAVRHEVVDLAKSWRARERERLAGVRQQMSGLAALVAAGGDAGQARDTIGRLRRLLSS